MQDGFERAQLVSGLREPEAGQGFLLQAAQGLGGFDVRERMPGRLREPCGFGVVVASRGPLAVSPRRQSAADAFQARQGRGRDVRDDGLQDALGPAGDLAPVARDAVQADMGIEVGRDAGQFQAAQFVDVALVVALELELARLPDSAFGFGVMPVGMTFQHVGHAGQDLVVGRLIQFQAVRFADAPRGGRFRSVWAAQAIRATDRMYSLLNSASSWKALSSAMAWPADAPCRRAAARVVM